MYKHKHLFKIIILGDSSVGKTCLLQQYVNKQFSMSYKATVGADFLSKQLVIDGESVTLQIWDTAGQERFKSIGGSFYKGSDCCVVVFDVTDRESFDRIQSWRDIFQESCKIKDKDTFPFIIIGNKIDMRQNREVSEEEGRAWEQKKNVFYFETSAKEAIGVEKAFQGIAKAALKGLDNSLQFVPETVSLNRKAPKASTKKCSC